MLGRPMRYVMVPVPSEHVREVISLVLLKSSSEGKNAVRDLTRIRKLVSDSNGVTRAVLRLVADATVEDTPLSVAAVAEQLHEDETTIRGVLRDLDMRALDPDQALVRVHDESVVDAHGRRTRTSYLTMPPRRAELVHDALRALDVPSQ